jgi:hypothetical protein
LEKSLDLLHAYGEFDRFIKISKTYIKSNDLKVDLAKSSKTPLSKKVKNMTRKDPIPVFRKSTKIVESENEHKISSKALTSSDFIDLKGITSMRH